jgi:hypothetical protein
MRVFLTLLGLLVTVSLLITAPATRPAQAATWAEDALVKEADYIVNCSFTEYAWNHAAVQATSDAYGAMNVLRIYQRGPDWARPGEAAMGLIGLMAAARQLKAAGFDITRYDQVLDRFFRTWVLAKMEPVNTDTTSADYGGFWERIYYDAAGRRQKTDPVNAGVTGQMIAAMWKFYEYQMAVGNTPAADDWLRQSWPTVRLAGDFLRRNYNPTYRLVRTNSRTRDLWVSDSTYAAMALRCLDKWATTPTEAAAFDYRAVADSIVQGLQALQDNSTRSNFLRYRDSRRPSYAPTYGDRIDQLCFLPYEADVLDVGEPFCRSISDWWTNGSDGMRMTFQSEFPGDWRHYGTRLRFFLGGSPESNRLFPGAALQLAKVEWKHAHRTGDAVTLNRAQKRFEWVHSPACSNLWLAASGTMEADVANGLVDWRDATDYTKKAGDWERFIDTSASFIEVVLMLHYGIDTRYVPG